MPTRLLTAKPTDSQSHRGQLGKSSSATPLTQLLNPKPLDPGAPSPKIIPKRYTETVNLMPSHQPNTNLKVANTRFEGLQT